MKKLKLEKFTVSKLEKSWNIFGGSLVNNTTVYLTDGITRNKDFDILDEEDGKNTVKN